MERETPCATAPNIQDSSSKGQTGVLETIKELSIDTKGKEKRKKGLKLVKETRS